MYNVEKWRSAVLDLVTSLNRCRLTSRLSPAATHEVAPLHPSLACYVYWYSWTKGSAWRLSTLGAEMRPVERGPTGCRFSTTFSAHGNTREEGEW